MNKTELTDMMTAELLAAYKRGARDGIRHALQHGAKASQLWLDKLIGEVGDE